MMTLDDYERAMCAQAGWQPTVPTLAVMTRWAHLEGIDNPKGLALERGWNIWMTTWPDSLTTRRSTEDIGFGPGKWNNANPPLGVGIYANPVAGISATIATIRGDARFAVIDRMFKESRYILGFRQAIETWIGSPAYAEELDDFAQVQYAYAPAPTSPAIDPAALFRMMLDASFGELWLQLFEMAAGTRATSFGTAEQVRLEAAVAALSSKTVPPHRHDMNLAVATTGPVTGVRG